MQDYKDEAKAFAENSIGELLDAWQCQDWGVTAKTFMAEFVKQFTKMARQLAKELMEEEE